jgi:hypothetical protein
MLDSDDEAEARFGERAGAALELVRLAFVRRAARVGEIERVNRQARVERDRQPRPRSIKASCAAEESSFGRPVTSRIGRDARGSDGTGFPEFSDSCAMS